MPRLALKTSFNNSVSTVVTHRSEVISSPEEAITYLDLRQIPEAVNYAWQTGRLPSWILNFSKVRILRASGLGVVVVDDWITGLTKLEVLLLDNNQICTWPIHLTKLKHLKALLLDGNPCLENMFNKSATFRNAFFGSLATQPPRLSELPESLNGPEWTPMYATNRASTRSLSKCYFCGGIYTIATPQSRDHDLFTPLAPCPLQERLLTNQAPPTCDPTESGQAMLAHKPQIDITFETRRSFQLLRDLMADISVLLGSRGLGYIDSGLACLTRTPLNLSKVELIARVDAFKLQEGFYIGHLAEIMRLFFNRKIKPWMATRLRRIFSGFPELYLLHMDVCLPLIKEIHRSLQAESTVPDTTETSIARFCREYEYCGMKFVASSRSLSNWTRDPSQGGGKEEDLFARWLEAQERDGTHTLPSSQDYLALPLTRLTEYHEFFTGLSQVFPGFRGCAEKVRWTREQAIAQLQNTRRELQQRTLAKVYQCGNDTFSDYHWDALMDVRSRTYLDRPKYDPVTADVVDSRQVPTRAKSAVKELFKPGERQLRIVMCGRRLQLWDHGLRSHIADVSMEGFEAALEKDADTNSVRIVFRDVDETCLCDLKEYHSVETFIGDMVTSFVSAVQAQSMPMCCSGEDVADTCSDASQQDISYGRYSPELLSFDFDGDDAEAFLNTLMSVPDHCANAHCHH